MSKVDLYYRTGSKISIDDTSLMVSSLVHPKSMEKPTYIVMDKEVFKNRLVMKNVNSKMSTSPISRVFTRPLRNSDINLIKRLCNNE